MTQDNGMDIESPSWQELKDERDALASHVEALHGRINALRAGRRSVANLDSKLATLMCMKPTTSLARIKAEWQAEALEYAAEMADKVEDDWLLELAKQIRRQAEE